MKKKLIISATFGLIVSLSVNVFASTFKPVRGFHYQHNPVTYGAQKNKKQTTYLTSSLTSDKEFLKYFKNGFKIYDSVDKKSKNRKYDLDVAYTSNAITAQANIYLNKTATTAYGVAIPCVIENKKQKCGVEYVVRPNVDFYKLIIYRKSHVIYNTPASRPLEATNTSAHEFGHTLGMGHYIKDGDSKPYTASYKSIMGYNADAVKLTSYDIARLQNLYGK